MQGNPLPQDVQENINLLKEAIKSFNVDDIRHYSDLLSHYRLQNIFFDIFYKDYEDTEEFKQSIEFILENYDREINMPRYKSFYIRDFKHHDNINIIKHLLQNYHINKEDILKELNNVKYRDFTIDTIINIIELLELLNDNSFTPKKTTGLLEGLFINIYHIRPVDDEIEEKYISSDLDTRIDQSELDRSTRKYKQLYKQLIYKILNFKPIYKSVKNILYLIDNIQYFVEHVDELDSVEILRSILQNTPKYAPNGILALDYIQEIYLEMFLNEKTYLQVVLDFINETPTIIVDSKDIELTMTLQYFVYSIFMKEDMDDIVKGLKHINSLLETLQKNGYTNLPLLETRNDVDYIYKIIFERASSKVKQSEEDEFNIYLLLSLPFDVIKKYDLIMDLQEKLLYKEVVDIFYTNYHTLDKYNLFEDFYSKLKDITGQDYSEYKIEEDPVIRLFENKDLNRIVEEYIERYDMKSKHDE